MPGLSELLIAGLIATCFGALLAGVAYLIIRGGREVKTDLKDGATSATRTYRSVDWQYAVLCGAGLVFVVCATSPIEVYAGKEESFFWSMLLAPMLSLAAIGFLVSWFIRRIKHPVSCSRRIGVASGLLMFASLCAPCLTIPAGVRAGRSVQDALELQHL